MYLILIETSGNQHYIFSTNKLRENVGASELTYQVGTSVVENCIKEINQKTTDAIEKIIATSGKALLLAEDETIAKDIVREVTSYALREMPGLTVHGAICKVEDVASAESLHKAVGDVHERLEEVRYQIPGNMQRFQRLPFAAECASSNLPAQSIKIFYDKGKETERKAFSQTILTKRNALVKTLDPETKEEGFVRSRVVKILEDDYQVKLFENLEKLEKNFKKKVDWLAVIHADGNGLGQIFLEFDKYADPTSHESYKKDYKEFSEEIDKCTRTAFGKSLQSLQEKIGSYEIPVVPLILGGDDLTFICDGEFAISLTKDFLQNFETQCKENEIIKRITKEKTPGICAGIAIIKPHYPFHQAYDLAEQLLQSAKKTKQISPSLSALDYHVLYDSSGVDLDEIRAKFKDFKVARPYIVSKDLGKFTDDIRVKNRKFSELQTRVEAIIAKEDGKRKLPNSQLHTLRERLHLGAEEADAFAKTISHRYETFKKLYVDEETIFSIENDDKGQTHKFTHFLDAMEIAEFWEGFGEENK